MAGTFFIFGAKYLYLACVAIGGVLFLRLSRSEKRHMVILACIALPLAYIVALTIAQFYFDPRPFVVGHFTPLVPHTPDNGFPSDHTLLTTAIAALFYPFRRTWSYLLFGLAAIVGVSRVYDGIHHATDVLGSLAIVLVSVSLSYALIKKIQDRYGFTWIS